jgi:dethiobiotin synthetase
VPELLVCATSAGVDARDLVRALERAAPAGTRVRGVTGWLAQGEPGEGLVADGAQQRGATVLVLAPGGPDLASHALLTEQAALARGLAVPAIIVAGPGGAAQRETLRAFATAVVVELPDPTPRWARSPTGRWRSGLPPSRSWPRTSAWR